MLTLGDVEIDITSNEEDTDMVALLNPVAPQIRYLYIGIFPTFLPSPIISKLNRTILYCLYTKLLQWLAHRSRQVSEAFLSSQA